MTTLPTLDPVYVPGGVRLDNEPFAPEFIIKCCGYVPHNTAWSHPRVFSPFWRLYYNFAPGHRIEHEGRPIALTPRSLVLIPANVIFNCVPARGHPGHLYIHFQFPAHRQPRLAAPLALRADDLAIALAQSLRRCIGDSAVGEITHKALSLLHWTLAKAPSAIATFQQIEPALEKTMAYMGATLHRALSNRELARVTATSQRNFLRMFTAQNHTTPQRYFRQLRLREAARRLAASDDSIDAIAEALGFPDRFYFTRCFTQWMGNSPARFRNACRMDRRVPGQIRNGHPLRERGD
jgi:AraC-like DNA-binding protein